MFYDFKKKLTFSLCNNKQGKTKQTNMLHDHMERKVSKYENHKLRERKGKTLTRIEEITKGTGTHEHTETESRYFDWHGRLPQSKESKC